MFSLFLLAFFVFVAHSLRPYRLRVEYRDRPRGIDVLAPRFFWSVDSEGIRNAMQTAYQIQVMDENTGTVIADTGKVMSDAFSHITIPTLTLQSHGHYKWTVEIYDSSDKASDMESSYFSAGLLNQPADWQNATWVGIPSGSAPNYNQIRSQFTIPGNTNAIRRAICYVASPGYYQAFLNDQPLDDHALGYFTTFEERVYYDSVACTDLIRNNDANVFGIVLGNGWYSQPSVAVGVPTAKVLIYIEFSDNSTMSVVSGDSNDWYQHNGPVRMNDIYLGEWYDATQETRGWLRSNYDYSAWAKASVIASPKMGVLSSSAIMAKSRITETYTPDSITQPELGTFVVDFGQNVAGYTQIRIPGNGARGTNVTMIHSEELDQSGFVVEMYSNSPMIATYTLRGDGNDEVYVPYFTYFGFQYVQITGLPSTLAQNDIESYFIHSDFDTDGSITFGPSNVNSKNSSAYLLNQVQHMTRYASLSNFINIPTDCPQRERRGWLGDAQLTAETTIFNFDMAAAYTKFLRDIRDAQVIANHDGALPDVVPFYHHGGLPGDPSWTCAYVNLVEWMHKYYGDVRLIQEHYEGMRAQMGFLDTQIDSKTGLLPLTAERYGDWCAVTNGGGCPHKSAIIATHEYAKQCERFSRMAALIGNASDASKYAGKFDAAKQAIYTNFWDKTQGAFVDTESGNAVPFSTAQALALHLGVLTDATEIAQCVSAMVDDMTNKQSGHLAQGIIGTKFILKELCRHGRCDVAVRAVSEFRNYPSYGYWVDNDATTLWENWESSQYHASGSKNHIMFGAESNWYYEYLGGIRCDANSSNWDSIMIDPYTNATLYGISTVDATVSTLRGDVSVQWKVNTNGNVCGTGDEGETVKITCGDVIQSIPFASYGTPTGMCGQYKVDASCSSNDSLAIVQALCVGKKECDIPVSNTEFKYDPCYDVKKHLDVEAICKTSLLESMNVNVPNGANATVSFRTLPTANYVPSSEWIIEESGKTIFKSGMFVNGDDGVVSGSAVSDDLVQIVVKSGQYSFARY